MVTETQPKAATRTRASDELAVPGFVVGSAVTRGRRAMARGRRLPGLSMLFVGAARGLASTAAPRVPALPWSAGLSPSQIWGWAARGDRGVVSAAGPASLPAHDAVRASLDPVTSRPVPYPIGGALPDAARAAASGVPAPLGDDLRRRSPELPSAHGLEAVAPALVLVRSMLGAPLRGATASSSGAQGGTAPSTVRRIPGGWSPGFDVGAARPTSARVEGKAGQPAAASAPPASRSAALPSALRWDPGTWTAGFAGRRDAVEPSLDPGSEPGSPRDAAARDEAARDEAARDEAARDEAGARRSLTHPAPLPVPAGPLPWGARATAHPDAGAPTARGSRSGASASSPEPAAPGAASEGLAPVATAPDVLPWGTTAVTRPGSGVAGAPEPHLGEGPGSFELGARRAAAAQAEGADPLVWGSPGIPRSGVAALPQREPRATPATVRGLVEVTDSLRSFVTREVGQVREVVASVASRPPAAPPPPVVKVNDETARRLLGQMRSLMQEERFRSGKLR